MCPRTKPTSGQTTSPNKTKASFKRPLRKNSRVATYRTSSCRLSRSYLSGGLSSGNSPPRTPPRSPHLLPPSTRRHSSPSRRSSGTRHEIQHHVPVKRYSQGRPRNDVHCGYPHEDLPEKEKHIFADWGPPSMSTHILVPPVLSRPQPPRRFDLSSSFYTVVRMIAYAFHFSKTFEDIVSFPKPPSRPVTSTDIILEYIRLSRLPNFSDAFSGSDASRRLHSVLGKVLNKSPDDVLTELEMPSVLLSDSDYLLLTTGELSKRKVQFRTAYLFLRFTGQTALNANQTALPLHSFTKDMESCRGVDDNEGDPFIYHLKGVIVETPMDDFWVASPIRYQGDDFILEDNACQVGNNPISKVSEGEEPRIHREANYILCYGV